MIISKEQIKEVDKNVINISNINLEKYKKKIGEYIKAKLGYLPKTLSLNKNKKIEVYSGDVKNTFQTNSINNKNKIYIEKEVFEKNKKLTEYLVMHELIHILSYKDKETKFGGIYNWVVRDINEGITQLLTEDIMGSDLSEKEYPKHYYSKNIMKIYKVLLGEELLIEQYFSENKKFEEKFESEFNEETSDFIIFAAQLRFREDGHSEDNMKYLVNSHLKEKVFVSNTHTRYYSSKLNEEFKNNDFLDRFSIKKTSL